MSLIKSWWFAVKTCLVTPLIMTFTLLLIGTWFADFAISGALRTGSSCFALHSLNYPWGGCYRYHKQEALSAVKDWFPFVYAPPQL